MNEPMIRIESDGKTVKIWKNGEKISSSMIDFHFHADVVDGVHITYEYEQFAENKNNEIVKERHIFDNRYERYRD